MAEPDPQVSTDSWRDPFTRFSGESEDLGAQLRDAGLAFAVQEQLRTALTELADTPSARRPARAFATYWESLRPALAQHSDE